MPAGFCKDSSEGLFALGAEGGSRGQMEELLCLPPEACPVSFFKVCIGLSVSVWRGGLVSRELEDDR